MGSDGGGEGGHKATVIVANLALIFVDQQYLPSRKLNLTRGGRRISQQKSGGWKETGRMQVFIQNLLGKTFPLEVQPSDTIAQIKAKVHEAKGNLWVPDSEAHIIFEGRDLTDDHTLEYYNIRPEATLHHGLAPKKTDLEVRVFVQTLMSEVILVSMESSNTVRHLKEKLESMMGLSANQHHLALSGKRLDDNRTLAESRIFDGALVVMYLQCSGGANPFAQ